MTVEMKYVQSTSIAQVGFDDANQELYVTFRDSGHTYIYSGVSEAVYELFMGAGSLGQYFNQNIKNVYGYRKQ